MRKILLLYSQQINSCGFEERDPQKLDKFLIKNMSIKWFGLLNENVIKKKWRAEPSLNSAYVTSAGEVFIKDYYWIRFWLNTPGLLISFLIKKYHFTDFYYPSKYEQTDCDFHINVPFLKHLSQNHSTCLNLDLVTSTKSDTSTNSLSFRFMQVLLHL